MFLRNKDSGMAGRYAFTIPCREQRNRMTCDGRFNIDALCQFLDKGGENIRCQERRTRQDIVELFYGLEEQDSREQLVRIETKLDRGFETVQRELTGLESRLANHVMSTMWALANEAKNGPRLFTIEPAGGD